jgi:type I restriction enzyme S subunit
LHLSFEFSNDSNRLTNIHLLYIQLKDLEFISNLQSKANSGVQVNLSTEAIKESEIIIPPIDVQNNVGKAISALYAKKENNDSQMQSLDRLRDTLLPKLISGEVTVEL